MKRKTKRKTKHKYTARTANKHDLYTKAVQGPEEDAAYLARLFKRMCGRPAQLFREDFCGTAALSCAWIKQHRDNEAIGVDLDAPTLAWGSTHNVAKLTEQQQDRLSLVHANVLDMVRPKVDLIAAMNFSYFIFKTRDLLRQYFKVVRKSLKPDGLFLMDAFGGSESYEELEEKRKCGGFTYVWEHARYSPVTGEILCHIHFEFNDGTRMPKAFTYDWRMWSLVEIQEILHEAGFSQVEIHWEGTDSDTGEGNGVFRKTAIGEAIESWVAYIVALP